MSIICDDAGVGLPVGGVIIGACRLADRIGVTPPDFVWEEVPPAYFQGAAYADKAYLRAVAIAAQNLLDRLHAPTDEPITVCQGWILSQARSRLTGVFSDLRSGVIGEPLQSLIETQLQRHLKEKYGFEIDYEILTQKPGLAFFQSLVWLKGGNPYKIAAALPEREAQCKTGWASWRCWADNLYPEAKELARQLKAARDAESAAVGGRRAGGGYSSRNRQEGDEDPNAGLPF